MIQINKHVNKNAYASQKQRVSSIGPLLRHIDAASDSNTATASAASTSPTPGVSNRERIMQRVKKVVTMFAHKHQQNQSKNMSCTDSEAPVSGTPSGLFKVAMMTTQTAAHSAKKPPTTTLSPKLPPDSEAAASPSTKPSSDLFKTAMAPVLSAKKLPAKKLPAKKLPKLPPVNISPIKVKPSKETSSDSS